MRLQIASTGLLPHVRHARAEQLAHLLRCMDAADDPVMLISLLLRAGPRYMLRASSLRMSARLALLQDGGTGGRALLFEAPPPPGGGSGSSASGGGSGPEAARAPLVAPGDLAGQVAATSLPLANTLLARAVAQQQARFISDCGLYMQVGAHMGAATGATRS